jgi:anti-repressor protein
MNSQLVPVFSGRIDGLPVQLCDARKLHAALEVGRDFSTWIKDRIDQYELVEYEDYITQVIDSPVNPKFGENGNLRLGRSTIEYHLTIDVAKELAMAENNARGRQVRRYFIQAEKELRELRRLPFSKRYRLQSRMLSLLKQFKAEQNAACRATIHAVMVDIGRQLGAEVPALEEFETKGLRYRPEPGALLTLVKSTD